MTKLDLNLIRAGQVQNPDPKYDAITQAATAGVAIPQATPITSLLQPPNAPEATPTIGVPPIPTNSTPSTSAPDGQFLQSLQTGPDGRPVFQNDAQRVLAINSGQYDPNYTTPLQKALATSIGNDRTATSNALIAHNQAANPLASASTPQEILQAQLAGDRTGLIKKIITKNQSTPTDQLAPNDTLQPYIGHIAPNSTGVQNLAPLDYNIIHDPDFVKQYAQDPQEGMRVYKALTGRDLQNDTQQSKDLIQKNMDFERSTFEHNIATGAKRNADGSWQINNAKLPGEGSSIGLTTSNPRPEYRPATPIENQFMERQYAAYAPGGPPQDLKFGSLMTRNSQAVVQQSATDPLLKGKLQAASTAKGGPLNPAEIFAIGSQHADQQAAQEFSDHPTTLTVPGIGYSPGPAVTKGIMNLHDLIANIAGYKGGSDVTEQQTPNALGKFFTDPFSPTPQASLSNADFDAGSNY